MTRLENIYNELKNANKIINYKFGSYNENRNR